MEIYRLLSLASVFAVSLSLLAGCGKQNTSATTATAVNASAFDGAPAEIKSTWDKAVAAEQTNDYVNAIIGYRAIILQKETLKPELVQAASAASDNIFNKLIEAAGKGDESAQQTMSALAQVERQPRR